MLKLKTGANTGSDTLTRDPTRLGQNRWPGNPIPSMGCNQNAFSISNQQYFVLKHLIDK